MSEVGILPLGFGSRLTLRVGCVLLEDAGHTILCDPGHFGTRAELERSLAAAAGITLADIDTVFFTHLHFDHYNDLGFADVGEVVLPAAELAFVQEAASAGLNGAEADNAAYQRFIEARYQFVAPVFMRQFLRLWRDPRYAFDRTSFADRLRSVRPGERISPNVEVVDLHGHSPGQCGLACNTRFGRTLIAGDALLSREDAGRDEAGRDHLIWFDKAAMEATRRACLQYDAVVPGHGPWFCPATATVLEDTKEFANG